MIYMDACAFPNTGACWDGASWNLPGTAGTFTISPAVPALVVPYGYQTTYTCNSNDGYVVLGKSYDTVRYLTCIWTNGLYKWSNSSASFTQPDVCARKRQKWKVP